jgi:hypothetical protein
MYSQRQFTPGKKSNSKKIINYISQYNALFTNSEPLTCSCLPDKYDKNTVGSDSPSVRLPYNIRYSQIINYSKGGKTQYGNMYLGQPLNINYLGRAEGMPGGSGSPPVNKF